MKSSRPSTSGQDRDQAERGLAASEPPSPERSGETERPEVTAMRRAPKSRGTNDP